MSRIFNVDPAALIIKGALKQTQLWTEDIRRSPSALLWHFGLNAFQWHLPQVKPRQCTGTAEAKFTQSLHQGLCISCALASDLLCICCMVFCKTVASLGQELTFSWKLKESSSGDSRTIVWYLSCSSAVELRIAAVATVQGPCQLPRCSDGSTHSRPGSMELVVKFALSVYLLHILLQNVGLTGVDATQSGPASGCSGSCCRSVAVLRLIHRHLCLYADVRNSIGEQQLEERMSSVASVFLDGDLACCCYDTTSSLPDSTYCVSLRCVHFRVIVLRPYGLWHAGRGREIPTLSRQVSTCAAFLSPHPWAKTTDKLTVQSGCFFKLCSVVAQAF